MKMKKRIVCIIPARLGSYRFPTKPFVDICGKSMIEHVYKRAELCKSIDQVYVLINIPDWINNNNLTFRLDIV